MEYKYYRPLINYLTKKCQLTKTCDFDCSNCNLCISEQLKFYSRR